MREMSRHFITIGWIDKEISKKKRIPNNVMIKSEYLRKRESPMMSCLSEPPLGLYHKPSLPVQANAQHSQQGRMIQCKRNATMGWVISPSLRHTTH